MRISQIWTLFAELVRTSHYAGKTGEYIHKSPFSAKICSDISPWTLSVTRRDQFSKGEAAGKSTLTNWLFLHYQLELEEQIFVFWSSLIHMKTSYPFYRKKRILN